MESVKGLRKACFICFHSMTIVVVQNATGLLTENDSKDMYFLTVAMICLSSFALNERITLNCWWIQEILLACVPTLPKVFS